MHEVTGVVLVVTNCCGSCMTSYETGPILLQQQSDWKGNTSRNNTYTGWQTGSSSKHWH